MKLSPSKTDEAAAGHIDAKISALGDWRGELLSRIRTLTKEAVPDAVEEWKWATPVWSCHGLICTGETYKQVVKMTFAKGASLADPSGRFNASLEGKPGVRPCRPREVRLGPHCVWTGHKLFGRDKALGDVQPVDGFEDGEADGHGAYNRPTGAPVGPSSHRRLTRLELRSPAHPGA